MVQFFDFIKSIGLIISNLITMVQSLIGTLIAGGTQFLLLQNVIPGPAQWFVVLCLAVPVVFIIIDIIRDIF